MLPTGVKDVLEKGKPWNYFTSRKLIGICPNSTFVPIDQVFWLGKIFLILSPFPQCPTKTCIRMGNIFEVPKESSICLKDRVERVPRGALRKRMKMPQNKLFKHAMHTFFIHTNICYMIDKMWFWRALYDFPFTCILRDAKMKKKKVIFKRTTAWCLAYLVYQKLALVCFQN